MKNKIYASSGKILTNGEIYGRTISLPNGMKPSEFYEISQEEYQKILMDFLMEEQNDI